MDMLTKHATSSECKNFFLAESSTLLKPEGTRLVAKPHLRWLESGEEDIKECGREELET
jgi:hypothetical protein